MAVYKMILRDGENPDTSKLHVIAYFCNAETKLEAAKLFDDKFGPKWNVAGPTKIEDESSIPGDANFIN
jgi:hypothetical protein